MKYIIAFIIIIIILATVLIIDNESTNLEANLEAVQESKYQMKCEKVVDHTQVSNSVHRCENQATICYIGYDSIHCL